jgi:dihydroorotase
LAASPEIAVGVKIRISREITGGPSLEFLRSARRVAEEAGRPVLVHIGNSVEPIAEILGELGAGDIVTHCQTPKPNGLVDAELRLVPEAWDARDRGVLFDSGHGVTHFDFQVARALLDQGFPPDVVSTDISRTSYADLKPGLITVMNKWLALGMPLAEVVKACTSAPADALQTRPDFGRLVVGKVADIAILSLRRGDFSFHDAAGRQLPSKLRLEPAITIKDGTVLWRRSLPVDQDE